MVSASEVKLWEREFNDHLPEGWMVAVMEPEGEGEPDLRIYREGECLGSVPTDDKAEAKAFVHERVEEWMVAPGDVVVEAGVDDGEPSVEEVFAERVEPGMIGGWAATPDLCELTKALYFGGSKTESSDGTTRPRSGEGVFEGFGATVLLDDLAADEEYDRPDTTGSWADLGRTGVGVVYVDVLGSWRVGPTGNEGEVVGDTRTASADDPELAVVRAWLKWTLESLTGGPDG